MMEKDEKIYESKITYIFDKYVILAVTISILLTYFMGGRHILHNIWNNWSIIIVYSNF